MLKIPGLTHSSLRVQPNPSRDAAKSKQVVETIQKHGLVEAQGHSVMYKMRLFQTYKVAAGHHLNHSLLARGVAQSSRVGSSQAHQGGLVVSLKLSSVSSTHPSLPYLPCPPLILPFSPDLKLSRSRSHFPALSLSLSLFLRTLPVCADFPPPPALSRSHCRYPSATHSQCVTVLACAKGSRTVTVTPRTGEGRRCLVQT
jgi:hypothetical protein